LSFIINHYGPPIFFGPLLKKFAHHWVRHSGDRIPVEARFSAFIQIGPGVHPASYTMGTVSFPGAKRPGSRSEHPPHLAMKLKRE